MKNFIKAILISLTLCFVLLAFSWALGTLISSVLAADYGDAISHAKDAGMEQSGINNMISKTEDYFKGQYVDKYVWSKDLEVLAGGSYYVYRHRSFPIKLSHDCKLTLATDRIGIEYHW